MQAIPILLLNFLFVNAVPKFDVNLSLPPQHRWDKVVDFYKREMVAMSETLNSVLAGHLGEKKEPWLNAIKSQFSKEHYEEIVGIVNRVNHPLVTVDGTMLTQILYELGSPTYCAGILATMSNGTVVHGRNMDYGFHFKLDNRTLNWPDVTFEVTFWKDQKPIMTSVNWPGGIGIHTGMRIGAWSFEQNTRQNNEWHANLAAAQAGGKIFTLEVRKLMELDTTFENAVQTLYKMNWIAPQYFIMAGAGLYEGAVLTIDRGGKHESGTPPVQRISNKPNGVWHLVQTNDDLLNSPSDLRRPIANQILDASQQKEVNTDSMLDMMHMFPIFNGETVFTWIAIPATGFHKTVLPSEMDVNAPLGHLEVLPSANNLRDPKEADRVLTDITAAIMNVDMDDLVHKALNSVKLLGSDATKDQGISILQQPVVTQRRGLRSRKDGRTQGKVDNQC